MSVDRAFRSYDPFKRLFDVLGSSLGLLVTAPVQLGVAIAVWIKLGRPVLFKQDRPGKHGVVFKLYKFRTMREIDVVEGLVTDEQRLSSFGVKLRSTSLDELPSLWNVLRGDMSIVGPRPLLVRYLDRYTPQQARRHEVRPGVTGLAQVSGRNAISWEDKFARDIQYLDERSLILDIKIIGRTLIAVVRKTGISTAGNSTACEFYGRAEDLS